MSWLNPWALIGLAGVALPVLIHLIARGRARTHRFPSLRFIDPSRLLPTRRSWVQDPLLLALRCAIVALAAIALAQPVVLTSGRKRAIERGVARAIVVDTSASMRRPTPSGIPALDSARRAARALAGQSQASIVVETNDPARTLQGAVAWLASQYQRAELVVISDFQRGQLDSADVHAVPADMSVALHRVPVVSAPIAETQWMADDRLIAVRASMRGDYTDVEWTPTKGNFDGGVTLLGAENDQAAMAATRIAAATTAIPLPLDSTRAIAIVFPGFANRQTLDTAAKPAYAPWMVDLLRRLSDRGNDVQRSIVVGRQRQLALLTDSAPASVASARMAEAAGAALSAAPPLAELEPETLSETEIKSLERQSSNTAPRRSHDPNGDSDARWLWAIVFVLLLIELPLRRRIARPAAPAVEERARAA